MDTVIKITQDEIVTANSSVVNASINYEIALNNYINYQSTVLAKKQLVDSLFYQKESLKLQLDNATLALGAATSQLQFYKGMSGQAFTQFSENNEMYLKLIALAEKERDNLKFNSMNQMTTLDCKINSDCQFDASGFLAYEWCTVPSTYTCSSLNKCQLICPN